MRGILIALVVMGGFIIGFALVYEKPSEPQQIAVVTIQSPLLAASSSTKSVAEPEQENQLAKRKMPEPIIITSFQNIDVIPDAGLRTFVRRKVNFRHDNVLFFEWTGLPGDKMSGVLEDKKYKITLHPARTALLGQEIVYRQIFVVPSAYSYVCEMAK